MNLKVNAIANLLTISCTAHLTSAASHLRAGRQLESTNVGTDNIHDSAYFRRRVSNSPVVLLFN